MDETTAIVIGAGVVGLACAAALAREGHEVLVLEAGHGIGGGISSRNSEVIHAGIYYPTNSLKHRLCIHGRRRLYPYLDSRNVAHRKCGKLIVATNAKEEAEIAAIHQRALKNGVENLQLLSGAEARALEPNLSAVSALLSPETGIVDSHALMLAYLGDIERAGGTLALGAPVINIEITRDERFILDIGGDAPSKIACRMLVNATGLHATKLAEKMSGLDPAFIPKLTLAKGSYFGCAGKSAFERLIYPAPVDGGLGVHLTLDLGGRMRFGPDVEWLSTHEPDDVNYEVDPARSESFYAAIRTYWPDLKDGALTADYSGCRPKLSGPGEGAADFRIDGEEIHGVPGLVNMFGIESPGLTSSLAIAEQVLARLEGHAPRRAEDLRPVIFFDRDGTLNEDIGYAHRVEDLKWVEGAIEAVRAVNEKGWRAIVVTNQSGIGRGYYTEADMRLFHAQMQTDLALRGAHIDAFYHAAHHQEAPEERYRHADHPDRKPNPGMLLRAMREHDADPLRALMIGDNASDVLAGRGAGVTGILHEGGDLRVTLAAGLAQAGLM